MSSYLSLPFLSSSRLSLPFVSPSLSLPFQLSHLSDVGSCSQQGFCRLSLDGTSARTRTAVDEFAISRYGLMRVVDS